VHDIDTGHSANIFCTKFVPETCDEVVVSGAGDAEVHLPPTSFFFFYSFVFPVILGLSSTQLLISLQVRVFNMSRLSGRRPREISMEPTAVYQCHSRRVKKLAVS
jgi:WD and tetratricopeptide repeat-containing protein 1